MPNASEVMTRNVITASPEMPIRQAAQLMVSNRFSGLPVLDEEGHLCGILTEGDLLRRAELGTQHKSSWLMALLMPGRAAGQYIHDRARTVGDVMTHSPVCVSVGSSIDDIVDLMEDHQIKRVPVLEEGWLAGIVSRSDILRSLLATWSDEHEKPIADAEIRKLALTEIGKQHWPSRWSIDIAVENGVISIRGVVTSERERHALRVACENTPGVKAVRDELTCVEPISGTVIEER